MRGGLSSSGPRPSWGAWLATLPGRARAIWRLKALVAALATLGFCVPYFMIGNYPVFPVRELPVSAVDRLVAFRPEGWVWVYQSIYVPINLIPWLTERREDLRRYAVAFALACCVSFIVFVLVPVRGPRPPVVEASGMYWLLQRYDGPLNSMPSLHAALLVLTLCHGRRILGGELPRGAGALAVVWAGLILYSTLATKQHYALDIVAGGLLGWCADAWAWRKPAGVNGALLTPLLGNRLPPSSASPPPGES
jgi:membrane-associated phospholipid phosphatase